MGGQFDDNTRKNVIFGCWGKSEDTILCFIGSSSLGRENKQFVSS